MEKLNNEQLKPKAILLKNEWEEMFEDLSDEQVGKMIKNCFRYLNQKEFKVMDAVANALFKYTIIPVLDYNAGQYQKKCENNRVNGMKGGRPKKDMLDQNPNSLIKNIINPDGYSNNPENLKDKCIDKNKSIEKSKDINTVKVIDTVKEKENENSASNYYNNVYQKYIQTRDECENKVRKLLELNHKEIDDIELIRFQYHLKMLEQHIGSGGIASDVILSNEDSFQQNYEAAKLTGVKDTMKYIRNNYKKYFDK